MARRRKTSPAEDLTDLVAMLPWWAGVVLALIAYLWLYHVASAPIAAATQLGQMGGMVTQRLWQLLATFGQYLLPFICLLGSVMSAVRRQRRRQRASDVDGPSKSIRRASRWNGSVQRQTVVEPPAHASVMPVQAPALRVTPDCPLCSKPMTRRTAKRGANAGRDFWGCTGYPACRGMRPIDAGSE